MFSYFNVQHKNRDSNVPKIYILKLWNVYWRYVYWSNEFSYQYCFLLTYLMFNPCQPYTVWKQSLNYKPLYSMKKVQYLSLND